ncbi:hypothetical protein QL285_067185 [Trifolium repens]|nr:hypothetical protein QL285_067185 [Trifolium repens]
MSLITLYVTACFCVVNLLSHGRLLPDVTRTLAWRSPIQKHGFVEPTRRRTHCEGQTLDLDFIIGRSTIVPCSRRLATAPDLLLTFLENQSILFLLKQRKSNLYVRSGFAANSCD